jgi:hypothetical protein
VLDGIIPEMKAKSKSQVISENSPSDTSVKPSNEESQSTIDGFFRFLSPDFGHITKCTRKQEISSGHPLTSTPCRMSSTPPIIRPEISSILHRINAAPIVTSEVLRCLRLKIGYEVEQWGIVLENYGLSHRDIFLILLFMTARDGLMTFGYF